jgi:glycosyltransferase involved in cell wall biosynthesis
LCKLGLEARFITPRDFRTVACPGYPEIGLALVRESKLASLVDQMDPTFIHIATEGPIGWAMRAYCLRRGLDFTTAYHTRFPEYLAAHAGVPAHWTYRIIRRFHASAARVMVATRSLAQDLRSRGFGQAVPWGRGVDTTLFRPRSIRMFGEARPVHLYVGRVSIEKNIEAFLRLGLRGKKVVVGDGPQLQLLRRSYPDVTFTGALSGEELAGAYASADVFVFPSRTDTFGLVLLEAMASGLPIAAYPVIGPVDVVVPDRTGALDKDLGRAIEQALSMDRSGIREHALSFSWENSARQFVRNLVPVRAQWSSSLVAST